MIKNPNNFHLQSQQSLRSSPNKQKFHIQEEKTMDLLAAKNHSKKQRIEFPLSPTISNKHFTQNQTYQGINQILLYTYKNNPPIYYIPCYLRMRVQKVTQVNYIESKAQIQTEIRIWIMIKQLPPAVQQEIINLTKLQINSTNKYSLSQIKQPNKLDHTFIKNTSKKVVGFLLSEHMELNIQSNPFWSPYQLIKLTTSLQLKKITLGHFNQDFWKDLTVDDQQKYKGATIQFNFLDAHPFLQFSFGQVRNLGAFDIAQSLVDMKFSNQTIKQQQDQLPQQQEINSEQHLNLIGDIINLQEKVKKQKLLNGTITPDAYQHGQIIIPLYKYPSTTIINVFVPFYMVAIMNLGVFFQANDMSNRNASLATFQLAYIAFFPTIRQNLPQTPKLVFAEILIYIQALCTIICFIYSLVINNVPNYVFIWHTNPIFLLCLILTILNICVVIGMFIAHKCFWEIKYNTLPKGTSKYLKIKSLNTDDYDEWWNKQCQQEFSQSIELGLVQPMFPFPKKKQKDPITSMLAGYFKTAGNDASIDDLNDPARITPLID